ncbi:MAG: fumarate hydratase [Acidobacteria bacterium]|nr:MAG: fumarate hydratase [Acidobacteriota bacterium]
MTEFTYQDPFPLDEDKTEYKFLSDEYTSLEQLGSHQFLVIRPEGLTLLARQAMRDVSFYLRSSHNAQVACILKDPAASDNDKFVARTLLKNAVISAEGQLPFCQDTGTAIVIAKKGQFVLTGSDDHEALSAGIFQTYTQENLRYSQVVPLSMYEEKNSGCNLPAQIDIYATPGDDYRFLFIAKGGGSANKTFLFQQTKALLNPASLKAFLVEKMKSLGTAACPPYHLACVIGGTSAEACLKTVKLASTGYLDTLPTTGNQGGRAFRDIELEQELLQAAYASGFGAQFGGKYFAHDIRVIRLSRHGASCPVGIGVSCSADRNIKAKITSDGIWLEQQDENPARWLLNAGEEQTVPPVKIDLNRPMAEILRHLSQYPVKTRLSLSGRMVVARDIAHARLKERLHRGEGLPDYFKKHPVYYAGPAKTPKGMPSGSFGPTTAGRMDPYVDLFQSNGGSMVMIAKGNRSAEVTEACKKRGGFYLGSIGGPAAILAKENIRSVKVLDYPELGMEAVWEIEVEDFPAFILVDDKGNDFFKML